jgi:hypothetical protein
MGLAHRRDGAAPFTAHATHTAAHTADAARAAFAAGTACATRTASAASATRAAYSHVGRGAATRAAGTLFGAVVIAARSKNQGQTAREGKKTLVNWHA